jgi:NAD(P)-dependent dehydrogenase (short-subunit alcohol dehydrogenase family)
MSGRLDGRVCVITGAAGGIGAECVQAFQREGARVVGVDLVDESPGDLSISADLTDEAQVRDLYAQVAAEFGGIDVLFNNAGISPIEDGSVLEGSMQVWRTVIDVNLISVLLCCKHGIPHLIERGGGSVINTASFVATIGSATSQIAYTAAKGGVLSASREMGVEFARRGVRVNALCPGPAATPLLEEIYGQDPKEYERRRVHLPLGRLARAGEIAGAAVFLASNESSYVTAAEFLVDGGASSAYVTPE